MVSTNPDLAKSALNAGADLIGVVLTPTSRRYVPIATASIIVKAIQQENSTPVLVFRDEPFAVIAAWVHELGDCIVQFQGGKRDDIHKLTATFNSIVAFSAEEFVHIPTAHKKIFC